LALRNKALCGRDPDARISVGIRRLRGVAEGSLIQTDVLVHI